MFPHQNLKNNHLKIWRKRNELPCFKIGKKGRKNIITAISNEELLLYKINEGTNTSISFLEFMKNLLKIIHNRIGLINDNYSYLNQDEINYEREKRLLDVIKGDLNKSEYQWKNF